MCSFSWNYLFICQVNILGVLGEKLIFRNFIRFFPTFLIGLSPTYPTLMICYDSEYYSSISSLK